MKLFKQLTENQEAEFRQWARDNYKPFDPIEGIWHPVIQDECAKINATVDLPRAFSKALTKAGYIHEDTTTQ